MTRRQTTWMLLWAWAALFLCGGAYADTDDAKVTLRLWHVPPKGTMRPPVLADRRVFEAFCKAYPEIKIRALVPLKIEGPASSGNEFLAVAGGVAPDVFYLSGRQIGDYYDQGFLEKLDPYLRQYQQQTGHPYRGISAPAEVWEVCQIEGAIYCVPSSYHSMSLVCDRREFARAGLPLRMPEDWEQLYRWAQRMTRLPAKEPDSQPGDIAVYGLDIFTGPMAGWFLQQFIWGAGGEIVRSYYPTDSGLVEVPLPKADFREFNIGISNADEYYPGRRQIHRELRQLGIAPNYTLTDLEFRLVIDEPGGVAALEFYRRAIHEQWIRCANHHPDREFDLTTEMLGEQVAQCPVCGEQVDLSTPAGCRRIYHGVARVAQAVGSYEHFTRAMHVALVQEISQYKDVANIVAVPFPPIRRDTPPAAYIAAQYFAINATQQNPRVRQAAWQYMAYMTGEEAREIRIRTYVESGLGEFIRPASLIAQGYEDELKQIPAERLALWDHLAKYPKVMPYCKGYQSVMTRQLALPVEAVVNDAPDSHGNFSRDIQQELTEICRTTNTLILGRPPEHLLRRRERIGWIVAAVIVALLVLAIWQTIRFAVKMTRRRADLEGFGVQGNTPRRSLVVILFLAPAVGSVLLWAYYPLLRGTAMAFQEYRIIGGSSWVGLDNFILTVSSPDFWRYVIQTFQYLLLSLVMGFFAPIVLALLLTEIPRGKVLYRIIYYLPAVTTGLVALFMWKRLIYDPTEEGLVNSIILAFNDQPAAVMIVLKSIIAFTVIFAALTLIRAGLSRGVSPLGKVLALVPGVLIAVYIIYRFFNITFFDPGLFVWFTEPWVFSAQKFLADRDLAMFWVVIPTIWAGVGPGCLIYLAALKGVPEEQYEAVDLDGGGIWAKCTNVVFPNLAGLMIINLVGAVVGAMKASSNIFVMTGGGPEDATMTIGLNVWFNAYMFLRFGLASAQAWILGAMLIGFTLYQLQVLNKMRFSSAASKEANS